MNKKYELTRETITVGSHTLHRIRALRFLPSFDHGLSAIHEGELGGYVESEANLSQEGECWVDGQARVYGGAYVCDNARVSNDAKVYGRAVVCGSAYVDSTARVYGNTAVKDQAAIVCGCNIYDGVIDGRECICGDEEEE